MKSFLARFAARVALPRFRLVHLSSKRLSEKKLAPLRDHPAFCGILDDLIAYTGFSEEELRPYLLRIDEKHFASEFMWVRPRTRRELTWFYRCSAGYLFGNAVHPYSPKLDRIERGRVLDYGAGVGCNSVALAKRGLEVDFVEIGRLQADFLRFRIERHGLKNLREVPPFHDGRFDPVACITESYDAILAIDVLEHIPDYHIVVRHFIEHLRPGGLIIENSPFHPEADEIAIHVAASVPLEVAMAGMVKVETGVWKKL